MRLLVDTHLLIWSAEDADRVPRAAREAILASEALFFSVASLWEVAIKFARRRPSFTLDPRDLRAGLLTAGFLEIAVEARHVLAVATLPPHHADPFDRMLVAQARSEGLALLTADRTLAAYGGPVQLV